MLTDTQRRELATGLGGSDALAYCGLDPHKTPVQLYADFMEGRRGRVDGKEQDPRIYWGNELEPLVRKWLANKVGRKIDAELPTFRHPDPQLDFLLGHMDGVMDAAGPWKDSAEFPKVEGVEIKTGDKYTSQEWGEAGTDQVPIRYVLQVQHYMAITSIRTFNVAVLLGGNDPRHYVVQYDEELVLMLTERARRFWDCVESAQAPKPVSLDDCTYRWPQSKEITLKASNGMLEVLEMLNMHRATERRAARAADELEVQVKAYMGNVAVLTGPDRPQPLATWRTQERRYVDLASLERDHPEIVSQYRRVNSHRVFRLK